MRRELCYPSSEIVVAAVTVSLTRAMGIASEGVKLQWIGFREAGPFSPSPHSSSRGRCIGIRRRRSSTAIIVFALLCDPMVTLWFNSLYTEFAVIWALYAAIAAITALAITERGAIPLTAVLVTALGALAFSREQFALLAPFLVARVVAVVVAALAAPHGGCFRRGAHRGR